MIKQPLKEYLQKLVAYNNDNDVSTVFKCSDSFTDKFELIKVTSMYLNTISDTYKSLFKRYMNNSKWWT